MTEIGRWNLPCVNPTVTDTPLLTEFRPSSPPRKLRPIRSHRPISGAGDPTDGSSLPSENVKGESSYGNQWPEDEILALLKIRSEIENPNEYPWEIVSRKLAELGYHRDAKKCEEKFKDTYNNDNNTKELLLGLDDDRSSGFLGELEAFDSWNCSGSTVKSGLLANIRTETPNIVDIPRQPSCLDSNQIDLSFSSDNDSLSVGIQKPQSRKRKRRSSKELMSFLDNLMKQVTEKQETMQNQLMELLEKRENDRLIREEAWKQQEMERAKRTEKLIAEQSLLAASRDQAVISFIEKFSGHEIHLPKAPKVESMGKDQGEKNEPKNYGSLSNRQWSKSQGQEEKIEQKNYGSSSSNRRWPKSEVQALLRHRIAMEDKFQSRSHKGSLWGEISVAMSSMGYNWSASKCKEKWENVTKYYKKTKARNNARPENAKTCSYFHDLDMFFRNGSIDLSYPSKEVDNETLEVDTALQTSGSANEEMLMVSTSCTVSSVPEFYFPSQMKDPSGEDLKLKTIQCHRANFLRGSSDG